MVPPLGQAGQHKIPDPPLGGLGVPPPASASPHTDPTPHLGDLGPHPQLRPAITGTMQPAGRPWSPASGVQPPAQAGWFENCALTRRAQDLVRCLGQLEYGHCPMLGELVVLCLHSDWPVLRNCIWLSGPMFLLLAQAGWCKNPGPLQASQGFRLCFGPAGAGTLPLASKAQDLAPTMGRHTHDHPQEGLGSSPHLQPPSTPPTLGGPVVSAPTLANQHG